MFGAGQLATLGDLRAMDTTGFDALSSRPIALVLEPDPLLPPDIYIYNPDIAEELPPAVVRSTVGVGGWVSRRKIVFIDGRSQDLGEVIVPAPVMPPQQTAIAADAIAIVTRESPTRKAMYRGTAEGDWIGVKMPFKFFSENPTYNRPLGYMFSDYPGQIVVEEGQQIWMTSSGNTQGDWTGTATWVS